MEPIIIVPNHNIINDVQDQNRSLGNISNGLNHLRNNVNHINGSLSDQNDLLNNIGGDIETGDPYLQDLIEKTKYLNQRRRTCWLWVLIIGLSVSLILILTT